MVMFNHNFDDRFLGVAGVDFNLEKGSLTSTIFRKGQGGGISKKVFFRNSSLVTLSCKVLTYRALKRDEFTDQLITSCPAPFGRDEFRRQLVTL